MYKLHLILKYLRKRRIAWVALIAVALCTTMVLVVISVMGGWLNMFRSTFHAVSGDIIVRGGSLVGFPHYQEMIEDIEKMPEVKAAAPTLRTFGLININNEIREGVQVIGYTPKVSQINGFGQSLFLQKPENPETPSFKLRADYLAAGTYGRIQERYLPNFKGDVTKWPGMIVGDGVVGIKWDREGNINHPERTYQVWAKLTLVPISPDTSTISPATDKTDQYFWIVDDSRTKVYVYDSNTVYVDFAQLQRQLDMEEKTGEDARPGRTSDIQITLKPGADLHATREKIERAVNEVANKHGFGPLSYPNRFPYEVLTWDEVHRVWLGAIENEKVLVTFLFGIISVVAVFMIFCIFYMIVAEKTRDIGIIKSIGATNEGVAAIFLGYGAALGVVGGGVGLLCGWFIVHYINELHALLGKWMGVQIWNPEVYLFDNIPNTMDPKEVTVIVLVAIAASIIGAILPAVRAARMDPVKAVLWD